MANLKALDAQHDERQRFRWETIYHDPDPNVADLEVDVAPSGNEAFRKKVQRLRRRMGFALQGGGDEILDDLTKESMIGTCIRGWRGLEVDGQVVEYDPKTCLKLFDEHEGFYIRVRDLCDTLAGRIAIDEQDAEGN